MKKKRKARSHSSKSINLNVLKKGVTVIFSGADKALTHKDICRQLQVKDKITFTGMGKLDLPTSGLGDPNKIMKTQTMERLPYRLQRKEFTAINHKMDSLGYQEINHWP